jgi:antiviral helicase SKI2
MAETLTSALAELSLNSQNLSGPAFDARLVEEEDGVYKDFKPRQKARQDAADLKQELEQEFLTPSSTFSPEWLNRLQRFDTPHSFAASSVYTDMAQEMGCPDGLH